MIGKVPRLPSKLDLQLVGRRDRPSATNLRTLPRQELGPSGTSYLSPIHQPMFVSTTPQQFILPTRCPRPLSSNRVHIPTHRVTEGEGAPSGRGLAKSHGKSLQELAGEPGLWAPRPSALPTSLQQGMLCTERSNKAGRGGFCGQAISCLQGKMPHVKSIP